MGKGKSKGNDFLTDDCGQNALQLAARGSALIAEILRLCEHIPQVFVDPAASPQYSKILCDFSYFTKQDDFEKRIQNSAELLERDEEFRETHIELLERFFKLFRGVFGYATELNRFVSDIKDGMYISQSMESVLVNLDGKQLLCEVYYLFGTMLLLLDIKMGAKVREYLIVSYIRYKGAGDQQTVNVAGMCRSTGFELGKKLPDQYPCNFFGRVPVDRGVINLLIGRLRSDDLYQANYHYPAPEHRSTALANQASMMYVLLFFAPDILRSEKQVMREIVDKHFVDNWVITIYMGFTVDLVVSWCTFKAASLAIAGTIATDNVTYHTDRMTKNLVALQPAVQGLLRDGVLTEQFVLDNIYNKLLPTIRDANVTLRWFMLHMTRGGKGRPIFDKFKKSYDLVANAATDHDVLTLLLSTAQLEFTLKAMFTQLLKEKRQKWKDAQDSAALKMTKLAQYFSGEHVLSDNEKVAQLEQWFTDIATRIETLSYGDSTTAGRKIQKLMKALENVQEFHKIDENLQVVQFLNETRGLLRQMIRITNIERKVLITISTVGDLSYAWELFSTYNCYVREMQLLIKKKPALVLQMRSVFVKLATMLELPCTRIYQAESNDPSLNATLESVLEYYSSGLVVFVRRVLHVIPSSIFMVLRQIMQILVHELESCPTKLAKNDMKVQSQLEVRERLSQLTSDIAQFASGILAMESTFVGMIQVDPHRLLEDGIRKELVEQLTLELDKNVHFDAKKTLAAEDFDKMLLHLSKQLHGMRNAFEYIQDYIVVPGLKVWLLEFSRIVNFNVDMECNNYMSKKMYHWKSRFQSETIPIRYLRDVKVGESYSFLGRLVQHLLVMTQKNVYMPALGAWFEVSTGRQVVGERSFNSIVTAIGAHGLAALDRLLCFMVAKQLAIVITDVRRRTEPLEDLFSKVRAAVLPTSSVPRKDAPHFYGVINETLGDLMERFSDALNHLGRLQLLRKLVVNELRSNSKLNSATLLSSLSNTNACLLSDLERHYRDPLEHALPGDIVSEMSPFLDAAGVANSASKVYVTVKPLADLPFLLMALHTRIMPQLHYSDRYACLLSNPKSKNVIDAAALSLGTLTLLKQFHADNKNVFFGLMAQYVRVTMCEYDHVVSAKRNAREAPPNSVVVLTQMLKNACDAGGLTTDELHRMIPPQLLCDVRFL
jgi:WASH complex subunit strumpellin